MRAVSGLGDIKHPVSKEALHKLVFIDEGGEQGASDPAVAEACVHISKLIASNPYGEYGLTSWPEISPRGIRDKAYTALAKTGRPLHFREVASAIDRAGWDKNRRKAKAHPQTVHNELIKDGRFVLVGRGIYALAEWGYQPGTVKEILVSVFKSHGRGALGGEDIIRIVSQKRLVKPQTILLNLQDRSVFKRTEEGKYALV